MGSFFICNNEKGTPHHLPHVMVKYGEYKANFCIETGQRLDGRSFPSAQNRVINKIIQNHKKELLAFWNNLQTDNPAPMSKLTLSPRA